MAAYSFAKQVINIPENEDKIIKPEETKYSLFTSLTGTPDCLISILVSSLLCLMLIVTVEVMPEGQDFSLHSFTIFVNGVTWEDRKIIILENEK